MATMVVGIAYSEVKTSYFTANSFTSSINVSSSQRDTLVIKSFKFEDWSSRYSISLEITIPLPTLKALVPIGALYYKSFYVVLTTSSNEYPYSCEGGRFLMSFTSCLMGAPKILVRESKVSFLM